GRRRSPWSAPARPAAGAAPPPPPARQRAAEASIDADPLVRQLREQFAAVVRDGTIEPLEAKA
ncbi:hypothetical protein OE433_10440, partial [Pseudomonas aeruginosa]|nr:hypothetical protein [Pseudomonas aeruginosa]